MNLSFTETLISEGYEFNDEDFDGCYVKHDEDECVYHCYQEGEDEGEWHYVKMTDGLFDIVAEYTINLNHESVEVQ